MKISRRFQINSPKKHAKKHVMFFQAQKGDFCGHLVNCQLSLTFLRMANNQQL